MIDNKKNWIETGYEIFSLVGLSGIRIEPIAKKVGISKSSFYHHFADKEVFIDYLLAHHIQQSHVIAEKERNCKNIDPELIFILIQHKTDLLFSRQLRIDRHNKLFNETITKSDQITGNSFVGVWVQDLNLKLNQLQLAGIFELALENFYLQITPENLNYDWLSTYFLNLKRIACTFN